MNVYQCVFSFDIILNGKKNLNFLYFFSMFYMYFKRDVNFNAGFDLFDI